jgi:hydrogenase maturation protein HypF
VRGKIDYEAQAAIELEMVVDESETGSYPFAIIEQNDMNIVHLDELFSAILTDIGKGASSASISTKFHRTIAQVVMQMCKRLASQTGVNKVALSGGVFQNRLLLRLTVAALEGAGLGVLTHSEVPANDGGISLGQAVIANFPQEGGTQPCA